MRPYRGNDLKNYQVMTLVTVLLLSSLTTFAMGEAQTSTLSCEQCGMTVDETGQARFRIVDSVCQQHVACCPVCALKMLKTYGELNITSFCDYNGPNFPIIINAKNYGNDVSVSPLSALIIIGGGCTKNRLVYDDVSADALLSSPNYGTSKWLSALSNDTVAANATRKGVVQAALQYGGGLASPSPSSTSVASLKECEVCGMDVTAESQIRYKVADGNGNVHSVECFMCVLSLFNDYETLHVETYCDWYGPDYPIIIDSSNFGKVVTVSPPTAMFLRGGSCVTARAAYNQTAVDNLLANGFSQYTSPEQKYTLPSNTEVKSVVDAIKTWYAKPNTTEFPTLIVFALAAVIGVTIVLGAIFAFRKLSGPSKKPEVVP